ncbi:MAG: rhodanese-like domain-containing protein [Rhodobacteraceae bacterium]|nr:MAG: rhodanese-like domain-containing protein [Paracoccaceae bacterium]
MPNPGLTRRGLLVGGTLAAGAGLAVWTTLFPDDAVGARSLGVAEAHRAALAGTITLVDIRRPEEWKSTGLGEGALPLDMRRPDFVATLDAALGGDRSRPVALICASGVRSARLARALADAGFTDVRDVPEGMSGSRLGPGWVRSGLPVVAVP